LVVPKHGGPPEQISTSTEELSGASLVVRDGSLLLATSRRTPRHCSGEERGKGQAFNPQCFDHEERIEWLALRDGTTTTVAPIDWAEFLVADSDAVYWTWEGSLNRLPLKGGDRVVKHPFDVDWPVRGLALDDARIYWVTQHGRPGSMLKP
jgi:hypothetical protein